MFKNICICIFIFFIGVNVFSQNAKLPRVMYVNFIEGLQIYSEPSINSNKIAVYAHGEYIVVYERSNRLQTVNGKSNYWYQIRGPIKGLDGKWHDKAWIFGGYLSEQLPDDAPAIIGFWDVENAEYDNYIFRFLASGEYVEGIKRSGVAVFGNWELNRNNLIIKNKQRNTSINMMIINRNEIILNYPDGNVKKLTRNFNRY